MENPRSVRWRGSTESLKTLLQALRNRIVLRGIVSGCLSTAVTLAAGALVLFAADRATLFPPQMRLLVSLIGVTSAAVLAWRWVFRPFARPAGLADAARLLERRFDSLEGFVLSAAELGLSPAARSSGPSKSLVEMTSQEAASRLNTVEVSDAVPSVAPLKQIALTGAATLIWASLFVFFPGQTGAFLHRFTAPLGDTRYPSPTSIASVEAPLIVVRGEAFQAIVRAEGVLPDEAFFQIRSLSSPSRRLHVSGVAGRYSLKLATVRENFSFAAEVGAARSDEFDVSVVERPRVIQTQYLFEYPSYTGLSPVNTDIPLPAIEGTRVRVSATFNKPVLSARLVFDDESSRMGTLSSDAMSASFEFDLTHDTTYRMRIADEHGYENPPDRFWTLRCLRDMPPDVLLSRPSRDLTVVPDALLPLEGEANDDFSVESIDLVYRIERSGLTESYRRVPLGAPGSASTGISKHWALRSLGLRPGDRIFYRLEASDNNPGRPQVSRSAERSLVVVTVSDKLAELDRLSRRLQANLGNIERRQDEVYRGVRDIGRAKEEAL